MARLPAPSSDSVPPNSRPKDTCPSATTVVADGAIVTLTVPENALPADFVVWLRYSGGSSGARLVDQDFGVAVEAIAAHPFSTPGAPVVVAPPSLLSAVGDSATVTLTFERALDATSAPPLSAFTANGSAPSAAVLRWANGHPDTCGRARGRGVGRGQLHAARDERPPGCGRRPRRRDSVRQSRIAPTPRRSPSRRPSMWAGRR